MFQPQAAPKTLLETAFHTVQQAFADATAAVMGAFQEGSAERMQLALEHLQALKPPAAAPQSEHDAQVADLLDAYADPTLHRDVERIARLMTSRAYKNGHCYATQEKIARWSRLPKSTLQLRLHEMERRDLIRVQRRPGTSSITLFADGTLDALRLKRIKRIATRERTNPQFTRTYTAPGQANPYNAVLSLPENINSWPKNTTCSVPQIATQSIGEDDSRDCATVPCPVVSAPSPLPVMLLPISRTYAHEEPPVKPRENVMRSDTDDAKKTQEKPAPTRENDNRTTSQNSKEEAESPIPPSIPPRPRLPAVALLVAEGVSPARAEAFARLFEYDRIERTVALSLHRGKSNPPGYLLRLIQDDAAAKRIAPGSEADRVRQRERAGISCGRVAPGEAVEGVNPTFASPAAIWGLEVREESRREISTPAPSSRAPAAVRGTFSGMSEPPGAVEDPLERLTAEERNRYAQRAREEVLRANAWLSSSAQARASDGPIMQAMIRKQLRRMLASTETLVSCGIPGL